jgi:uncharacterized protein YneF (UPF0154 family)
MASTKRTWLWIIFGVVLCIALGVAGLVAGGVYMVSKHVRTELVGRISAQEQFVNQRDRFTGQKPLIEMSGEFGDHKVTVHRNGDGAPKTELQTMRVLVYDAHEGRLVHVDLPFWLLRLVPSGRLGNVSGSGSDFSFESGRITVDDLERHGPGLILDAKDSRDAQILIWTE